MCYEILQILTDEKCPFQMVLRYIKPSFSYLENNRKKIRGDYICSIIATRKDLTVDEKTRLLPKSQYKRWARRLEDYV
jgi:hypothetical protein